MEIIQAQIIQAQAQIIQAQAQIIQAQARFFYRSTVYYGSNEHKEG